MSNFGNTYNTRATRLGYSNTNSTPFGLWTLPDPLDGPSFAPCYGPYGESSPAVIPYEPAPLLPATNIIQSDVLKPWERGTKSGKKFSRTKKSRLNQGGKWDGQGCASSNSSITGSSSNSSEFGSNASSAATTPTEMSPQSSHATYDSQVPSDAYPYLVDTHDSGLVFAQTYQMCPSTGYRDLRHKLLNRQMFAAAMPAAKNRRSSPPCAPTTAQAAIAEQRKRKFDRVASEEPVQLRKSCRRK